MIIIDYENRRDIEFFLNMVNNSNGKCYQEVIFRLLGHAD